MGDGRWGNFTSFLGGRGHTYGQTEGRKDRHTYGRSDWTMDVQAYGVTYGYSDVRRDVGTYRSTEERTDGGGQKFSVNISPVICPCSAMYCRCRCSAGTPCSSRVHKKTQQKNCVITGKSRDIPFAKKPCLTFGSGCFAKF